MAVCPLDAGRKKEKQVGGGLTRAGKKTSSTWHLKRRKKKSATSQRLAEKIKKMIPMRKKNQPWMMDHKPD